MPLTQAEADALLQMPKQFVDHTPLEFPQTQPVRYERELRSMDKREQFLFDFERGNRNRARLKYQTRGRKVLVPAGVNLMGPAQRIPQISPFRPHRRWDGPFSHVYFEGFEKKV